MPFFSRSASRNAMTQSDSEDLVPRRPMTSRSASRNAMTQVDEDYLSKPR